MIGLQAADLQGVLSFLEDVSELEFDEPYPVELMTRLQDLVPCEALTYQEADLRARTFLALAGIGPDGGADDEQRYWALAPCPLSAYRATTGDLSALRMSDVIGTRRFRELPIFLEYFHPAGWDYMLDLGLPAGPGRHRSFILFRGSGAGDFSERDRAVLDMLRPHLCQMEAHAGLRRRLAEALRAWQGDARPSAYTQLTPREREVVELAAEGKTNSEIAAQLWIAPSIVKKHLEHVYEKLDAPGRMVAARLVPARTSWTD